MGFNQFSRPVQPVDQYLPISDEILARGAMETYNKAGQLGQKLAAYNSNLFGITTYGKDAEVLQDYENQFNQQVAELSKGDITSPQALSKFNSLVSNFSNSPDILGIHERNATYNSELKAKKDAEAKGLSYTSPLIKDAQSYYSGDKYYTDKRFTRSGWVSPDTTKAMDEAVKAVTKQQYDPKTGFVTKTAKPEEVAANFYERMKNNPNYQKDLEYGFEQETEGVNWQDNGHQFVQGKVNKLTQQYNEALADGNQEAASLAQHELNRLQNLADPSLIGEELKKQAFQNHINTQLEKVGYANDVLDFQKIERDPIDMKLLEHKLNMQEDLYKKTLEQQYPKENVETLSLIQGLEDFKQTKAGIPGLLNTDIFQKEVPDVKETQTFEYDTEGNKVPKSTTVTESKRVIKPRAVGYRDSDDTFTIRYDDGSVDQLTTQQIIDKVATAKPALAKNLKQSTNNNVIESKAEDIDKWTPNNQYKVGDNTYFYNTQTKQWQKK